MAHVRAAIGSPVQQTNCHPFRDGRWLFVHNGFIADFHTLRRDLMLAVDPARFADIHGSTDTEVVFYLALAFGLGTSRSRRSSGRSASSRRRREHGVDAPLQASFGVADGDSLWAVRYASEGVPRSLFASSDVEAIQRLHPDNPRLQRLSPGDRLIVSEPVNELPGLWYEIEPSTAVTVRRGGVLEHRPFRPRPEGPLLIVRQFAGTADGSSSARRRRPELARRRQSCACRPVKGGSRS